MDVEAEAKKFGRIIGKYLDQVEEEIQDLTDDE
jgi:hypothetical protein